MAAEPDLPRMTFVSAADWERWLADHHADSRGVWLQLAKKGSGIASVTYADALDVALCFGWIDGRGQAGRPLVAPPLHSACTTRPLVEDQP